ncbi:P-loop containing nucleoside triphosphate hydrolase protein [Mycena latifolia]|nr:P-loop containing nucleoside triphosphate hydrolase protein [Mycena latifolia]KAJ7493476.1 P-loop containing nucleoside triphosphate hydrolase protein [Mycena latifolia]
MAPSRGRRWQTPLGHKIIQRIVKAKIPGWKNGLHHWQLIIVAWILDGEDVLCVTATGDGKSALFTVPIIVLLEVAENPAAYPPTFVNQKKPVGIVISPTKGLSANMITELAGHGVKGLAFSSETLTEARKSGRNLGAEIAECKWPIVCIDPEHLIEKQWERIMDSELFRQNIAFVCTDEAHFIDEWGEEFRPAFRHIGPFLRGCLPQHISVFALTATLQPGAPTRSICRNLGLQKDMFHLVRRSNERPNVQFLLSPLTHGLGGDHFPDLLQYLKDNRKSIIYCATIELCWRVYIFLLRLLPPGPQRLKRVRLYHAMCWSDENEETVRMIRDDPECQIVVATVAFGQGFNIRVLLDSLMLGVPKTVAQTLQQAGRVGRDQLTNGRAVVFVQAASHKSAVKYLAQDPAQRAKAKQNSKSLTVMNNEKALMLTAVGCLIAFFNKMYGNSGTQALLDCIAAGRRLPCSNCRPRFIGPLLFAPSPIPIGSTPLDPFPSEIPQPRPSNPSSGARKRPRKLTKVMRATAEKQLRLFKDRVQKSERDRVSHGYTPASSYLSNPAITSLLDNFLGISTVEALAAIMPKWKHHIRHGPALLELMKDLQETFARDFESARLKKNEANRAKARAKRDAGTSDVDEEEPEDEEASDVDIPAIAADEAVVPPKQAPIQKRPAPLDDTTNEPRPKRSRAAPLSVAAVAETFRPQYKARTRTSRSGQENRTT